MEELTDSSIRLAAGMSEHGVIYVTMGVSLVIIFMTVTIYTFQQRKMMDNFSALHEQMVANNKALQEQFMAQMGANLSAMVETVNAVKEYLNESLFRKVSVDQARALIENALDLSKCFIILNIIKIKQQNSLSDVNALRAKVRLFVDNAYNTNIAMLRKFEYKGNQISGYMESDWRNEVIKMVMDDCVTDVIDANKLETAYRAIFLNFKDQMNGKIDLAN